MISVFQYRGDRLQRTRSAPMILVEHINPVDGALLVGIVSRDAPGQRFRFQSLGLVDAMSGYVGVGQLFLSPTKVLTSAPHMSKLLVIFVNV